LHLWLRYTLSTDELLFATDLKDEAIFEVLTAFLQDQSGAGVDKTPPVESDVYNIRLRLDLSYDTFSVNHDCGNLGLRDGILIKALTKFRDKTAKEASPEVLWPKDQRSK